MNFTLTEEQKALQQAARELAEEYFAPRAAYWDEVEEYPWENHWKLAELGYLGYMIPVEYGGSGGNFFDAILIEEQLARACKNTATIFQLFNNGPSRAITILGTDEQKQRLLPKVATGEHWICIAISEPDAGSAVTDMKTKIEEINGELFLTGTKSMVTGGHVMTHALVAARFGDSVGARGIGAVIVERGMKGFEIGAPARKMGGRAVSEAPFYFDKVHIPRENVLVWGNPEDSSGLKTLLKGFGVERIGNAIISVGVAQAAYERALAYSKERHQFGRPICEFQGIQWKLAEMAMKIEAARLMTYRAAVNAAAGFPSPLEAAMAKYMANKMAAEVCDEAIQIHGHSGFLRDLPLERMWRDVRGMSLGGGTLEILLNTIAAEILGRRFNQRRS